MADQFDPYAYLILQGMPQHIAEGFMDNFMAESGLNPTINEVKPLVEGSRGGRGYYQLTGDRRKTYEDRYGTEYGGQDQMDHLLWELENTEKRARDKIYGTDSRSDAAMAIAKHFLRPAVVKDRSGMWKGGGGAGIGANPDGSIKRTSAGIDDEEPEYADNIFGRFKKKSDLARAGLGEKLGLDDKQMAGIGAGLQYLARDLMRGY